MDVDYPPDLDDFRAEIRSVFAAELPDGWQGVGAIQDVDEAMRFVAEWRRTLARHRLLSVTWPQEYGGRGLTRLHQVVLMEELARAGLPFGDPQDLQALKMLANTLLEFGDEEQKKYFLPRILSGADRWCQGYSEPGAGSDLAALSTRAVRDGDEWVINGQKVWTSGAQTCDWIFLLCRTDPGAVGHAGISFLLCPMDQPGVEVRAIRQLSGRDEFAEVFFTDARTGVANTIGKVNDGWAVANGLLRYERGDEAATNPILFRAELDRMFALAREHGQSHDPVIRQQLAACYVRVENMRHLGYRILTNVLNGTPKAWEPSVAKLLWSEYHRVATELALEIEGLGGLVPEGRGPLRPARTDDPGAPNTTGSWLGTFYNARAGTIYAGTSQVQRNILAEKVLGLPRAQRPAR